MSSDPSSAGLRSQTLETPSDMQELLSVKDLTAGYRGRAVIYDVALEVGRGEIVAILGSNGERARRPR